MHLGFSLLTLFPGRVGGSETYVRGLLDEFARGHGPERVTVLANRHVEAVYEHARGPVTLRAVRSYRAGDRSVTRAAALALARVAPRLAARDVPAGLDVLHLPVTVPVPRLPLPTVVTIHEVQLHDRPEVFSRAERAYRRWAYDSSARDADVVVAVSEYVRDRLVEHVGVDPGRIRVVHLGIDHARLAPEPQDEDEAVARRHHLPGRFVLYPANLWQHKNHERLIDAFARVDDDGLELLLAGETYGRLEPLLERARRAGVERRVRHLGHVPPGEIAALLRRATALVFPSLYEGFGAPPLEAMACGCPVASSTRASLAEVCGEAALAFDPEDPAEIAAAIESVATDDELRAALRERGLEHAGSFSWETAARGHVAAYEQALGA